MHESDAQAPQVLLRVVCTDQGQHKTTQLAVVESWGDDHPRNTTDMPWDGRQFAGSPILEDGEAKDYGVADRSISHSPPVSVHVESYRPGWSRNSHRFKCRRCGRDLIVREEKWDAAVDKFVAAGLNEVDVSQLDRLRF